MTWTAEKISVAHGGNVEFEFGEEWKSGCDTESDGPPPMPLIWVLCECCHREFSGDGQETLDAALRAATASGWKKVSQRFDALEDVDPALAEDAVCPKCWVREFST
jgi:hypothetical protein